MSTYTHPGALMTVIRASAHAGVAPLLWGESGIGKSSLVRDIAAADSVPCETVLGSIREPSDFNGLPVVTDTGVRMEAPSWAKTLAASEDGGWLLLDELTTVVPAVQKAMLAVILDHVVGDLRLPDRVRIIAAANPPDSAVDGWDLAAPLANRFLHVDYNPAPAAWLDGLITGFPVATGISLLPLNAVTRARARGSISAFLRHRDELLHVRPEDPTLAGRAWPSRRTWTMLADVLAQMPAPATLSNPLDVETAIEATHLAASGLVGAGAAAEYLIWREHCDLPDPEAMLDDPDNIVWPTAPDHTWAACSAAMSMASCGTRVEWNKGWAMLASASQAGFSSVAAACGWTLMAARPQGAKPPASAKRLSVAWREAGLLPAESQPV